MKRFLFATVVLTAIVAVRADNHSTATLRAEYQYEAAVPQSDSIIYSSDKMALQIAPDESRYFSIATEFYDSIVAVPGGKELLDRQMMDALNNTGGIKRDASGNITSITVSKNAFDNVPRRKGTICVYKNPSEGNMTVFDRIKGPNESIYAYDVEMNDIEWEPGDSIVTILDHECQNATAMYHGRRWTAWFAPDIPVNDGPWQLHGLPGLIMKAESDGGEYRFTITALYECDEPIKDIPGNPVFEKTDRKTFLRILDDNRRHPSRAFGIMNPDPPCHHDLPETDYK